MPSTIALLIALAVAYLSTGCRNLPIDESMAATAANDKTLAHSACHAGPSQGYDVCRVVEGAAIAEEWVLVVPWTKEVDWAELEVRYRDRVITYAITEPTIRIPWKEIVDAERWTADLEAPVQARAALRYQTKTEPIYVDLLGYAFPIVLKQGYSPLPMDSGAQAFAATCRIQYTTAGRSAIECK